MKSVVERKDNTYMNDEMKFSDPFGPSFVSNFHTSILHVIQIEKKTNFQNEKCIDNKETNQWYFMYSFNANNNKQHQSLKKKSTVEISLFIYCMKSIGSWYSRRQ